MPWTLDDRLSPLDLPFDEPDPRPPPGRVTLTSRLPASPAAIARALAGATHVESAVAPVQREAAYQPELDPFAVHLLARTGVAGAGGPLPHLEAIQASFGHHDLSSVRAH